MSLGLCLELSLDLCQEAHCKVCEEPIRSDARFTAAWGLSAEHLIEIGVCPLCRSMPPVSGRNIAKLRAAWLAAERPATRPGVGLPFDLI